MYDGDRRVALDVAGDQYVFGPSCWLSGRDSLETSTSAYEGCVESSYNRWRYVTTSNVLRLQRRQRENLAIMERR
jgi:hypothetical protein